MEDWGLKGVIRAVGAAVKVASGIVIRVAGGTAIRVASSIVIRVAGGTAVKIASNVAIRVAGGTAIRTTSKISKTASSRVKAVADNIIAVAIGCILDSIMAVG